MCEYLRSASFFLTWHYSIGGKVCERVLSGHLPQRSVVVFYLAFRRVVIRCLSE